MSQKLLILSDLWGKEKTDWLPYYTKYLAPHLDIRFYDSCELANMDKSDYSQEKLHQQFLDGGIEKAIEQLIECENNAVSILAFSVGGTIAWKYAQRTHNVDSLICISSTRLRYETAKPKGSIRLFFGANDAFKPSDHWFEKMKITPQILKDAGHEVYMNPPQTLIEQILISLT